MTRPVTNGGLDCAVCAGDVGGDGGVELGDVVVGGGDRQRRCDALQRAPLDDRRVHARGGEPDRAADGHELYRHRLAAGTYYYRVTAEDAAGNIGPASNEAAATVGDTTRPRRRGRSRRSGRSGGDPVLGCVDRQRRCGPLQRAPRRPAPASRPGGNRIAQPTGPSYVDTTAPGSYFYKVTAEDAAGNISAASNEAARPSADTTAPSAPSGLAAPVAGSTVNLSWTASRDNVGVIRYNVHRGSSAGFTPSAANRIAQPTGPSYADTGLATGSYFYKVTAEDAAGNISAASNEATATVADATPPTCPGTLTATAAGSTINLSWGAATDNVAVSRYNLHRGTTSGFTPSTANRIAQPTGLSYADTTSPPAAYFYKLTAEDAAGNIGPVSQHRHRHRRRHHPTQHPHPHRHRRRRPNQPQLDRRHRQRRRHPLQPPPLHQHRLHPQHRQPNRATHHHQLHRHRPQPPAPTTTSSPPKTPPATSAPPATKPPPPSPHPPSPASSPPTDSTPAPAPPSPTNPAPATTAPSPTPPGPARRRQVRQRTHLQRHQRHRHHPRLRQPRPHHRHDARSLGPPHQPRQQYRTVLMKEQPGSMTYGALCQRFRREPDADRRGLHQRLPRRGRHGAVAAEHVDASGGDLQRQRARPLCQRRAGRAAPDRRLARSVDQPAAHRRQHRSGASSSKATSTKSASTTEPSLPPRSRPT